MLRKLSRRFLLAIMFIATVMVFSGTLFAQGRSEEAFERVKAVQERHTQRLMAINDVEGTAIGLDENDEYALKVFTARPGVGGIASILDGVPVRVVVTGKFYSFPKPEGKPGGGSGGGGGKGQKDRTPPATPIGLTATAVSSSQINLSWTDNSNNEKGFKIERDSVLIATVGVNITSYSNIGLAPSTGYTYRVYAYNDAGNSGYSNEASATTQEGSPPLLDPSDRFPRPVPIGVSTGHPDVTAGTIGCRLRDVVGNVYALSNNHVYANENLGIPGVDNVLQPGTYDGGIDPDDRIGTLTAFVPIVWYPWDLNIIDAAIAVSDEASLGNATPSDGYGQPSSTTKSASMYMNVQKYGRTTGLTKGQITGLNGTFFVQYSSHFAIFTGQIVIESAGFSAGGDSGSLIVTDDEACNPVGLLFAGSSTSTIANPIDAVLDAFSSMSIDGKP